MGGWKGKANLDRPLQVHLRRSSTSLGRISGSRGLEGLSRNLDILSMAAGAQLWLLAFRGSSHWGGRYESNKGQMANTPSGCSWKGCRKCRVSRWPRLHHSMGLLFPALNQSPSKGSK